MIFYYHLGYVIELPASRLGEYAVTFYILAAGISYLTFSGGSEGSNWNYFKRRARAILPTYWLVNGALYLISFFIHSNLQRPFSFMEFILSFAGVSQYFGIRYLTTSMWFIPFVLQLYLVLPLLRDLLLHKNGVVFMGVAGAISLLFNFFTVHLWPDAAMNICRNWSPLFRLPEICLGLAVGAAIAGKISRQKLVITWGVFGLTELSFHYGLVNSNEYVSHLSLWGTLQAGLVVLIAWLLQSLLSATREDAGDLLRECGKASFPFFLIHAAGLAYVGQRFGWTGRFYAYFAVCWLISFVWAASKRSSGSLTSETQVPQVFASRLQGEKTVTPAIRA